MKFNWLDIVIMVLAVRGAWVGVKRGILGEIVLASGVIASVVLAAFLSATVRAAATGLFPVLLELPEKAFPWLIVVAGVAVSVLVSWIVHLVSHMIIQTTFDQALGAILGLVRAAAFTGILITYFVMSHNEFAMKHTGESVIGNFLVEGTIRLHGIVQDTLTKEGWIEPEAEEEESKPAETPSSEAGAVSEEQDTPNSSGHYQAT